MNFENYADDFLQVDIYTFYRRIFQIKNAISNFITFQSIPSQQFSQCSCSVFYASATSISHHNNSCKSHIIVYILSYHFISNLNKQLMKDLNLREFVTKYLQEFERRNMMENANQDLSTPSAVSLPSPSISSSLRIRSLSD
jgi:hypothetical protein